MTAVGAELAVWLAAWLGAATLLLVTSWRRGHFGCGLVFAYVFHYSLLHWFGALAHAFPWNPFWDSAATVAGFKASTYGMVAFAVGSLYLYPMLAALRRPPTAGESLPLGRAHRLAWVLMFVGSAFWLASYSRFAHIPTVSAIVSAGKQMVVVGVCLKCWLAWGDRRIGPIVLWLGVALVFPVVTVLMQGFLGYGVISFMTLCAFVGMFYRPRWQLVVLGIAGVYLGLSLFVVYSAHRQEIRYRVWYGGDMETRVESVLNTLGDFELLNPRDEIHLRAINARLNQNELVGAAVEYTPQYREHARGLTFWQALIALVPRALWPDKPVVAGSMGLVTQYTGIGFDATTSVGLGQVLEFYINFGHAGVIVGFVLLGAVITHIDRTAGRYLIEGDWDRFAVWLLVGISAMQVGGSLVEMTSSMAAGAAAALGLERLTRGRPT